MRTFTREKRPGMNKKKDSNGRTVLHAEVDCGGPPCFQVTEKNVGDLTLLGAHLNFVVSNRVWGP